MNENQDVQALVVGAGPVGLTMACELSRHGVACRIVDQDEGPTDESRALAIWPRTQEVFEKAGVIGPVLDRARRMHGINAYAGGRRIAHLGLDASGMETAYPFALSLPQGETERILLDKLEGSGARVERRTKLMGLRQDGERVTATVEGPDGSEKEIRASWLIGCDGSHSAVRHALGLAFEGAPYPEAFLLADVRVAWGAADDEAHMFLREGGGAVAAFPLPEAGRWRLIDVDAPVDLDDPHRIVGRFQGLLRDLGHPDAIVDDPRWATSFHIHERIVDRFRVGRCFVAGDAAHIHSPAGGQGMNTGIQDAANLAWKLGLVVPGVGREPLLDSYEAERRPVALGVLRGTDWLTRVVTLRGPVPQAIRNTLMALLSRFDFLKDRASRGLSELGIDYRRSPIVSEDRAPLLRAISHPGRLGEILDFGAAPHAGDRLPDFTLPEPSGGPRRLYEALDGTGHTLLLFIGGHRTDDADRALIACADLARDRLKRRVSSLLVVPSASLPTDIPWSGAWLPDADGSLHHHFGAEIATLYFIRPDGYIGYRAQPADLGKYSSHLGRCFA